MANEIVLVGCKLPSGLEFAVGKQKFYLKGCAVARPAKSRTTEALMIYPPAYTPIPKEAWDAFVKQMGADWKPFESQSIFWAQNRSDVNAKAKELDAEKTGFEAVDPKTISGKLIVSKEPA